MRAAVFADPPVLCGHRGSGKGIVAGRRENTLESFRAAVAAGLGWVEVDARMNADGVLVSRHDPALEDALRERGATTAALVADLVAPVADAGRPLLVSSFDPSALLIVRERVPGVPVGLLTWRRYPVRKAITACVHLGAEVVAPHFDSLMAGPPYDHPPEELVTVAHSAGLQVLTWSVPAGGREAAIAVGADCLVIDDVALASPGL